jgi:hypothetical protein
MAITDDIAAHQNAASTLWHENLAELHELVDTAENRLTLEEGPPGASRTITQLSECQRFLNVETQALKQVNDLNLVPMSYLTDLLNASSENLAGNNTLNSHIEDLRKNGGTGTIRSAEYKVTNPQGNYTVDFNADFIRIDEALDKTLTAVYRIKTVIAGPSYDMFAALHSELSSHMANVRQNGKDAEGIKSEIEKILVQSRSHESQAKAATTEAERLRSESESIRKTVAEHEAQTTIKLATIEGILTQATNLKNSVEAFQSYFDLFQKQLETRNTDFTEGKSKVDDLINRAIAINSEIAILNQQASDMLQGATNAGLSGTFKVISDKL